MPDKSRAGDNLGNHTATQDVNLNGHRLLHPDGSALGDSVGHVEINGQVNDASVSLITRSQNGVVRKYSRVMLSGYGKLPDGNPDNNDYGLWATAYREKAWAGFFSAGNTKAPLRFVGICQNLGYDGTGSAIRIVDGTQSAGKVLTSNASGYGTWQTPAPTAAGGNFDLGTYYLVGNGGGTGLSVSNSGQLGVGVTGPFGRLSNSTSNLVASDTYGGSTNSLNWQVNQSAYAAMVYNAGTAGSSGGLAVKIANASTAGALDISRGGTATGVSASLFRVSGNGYVGIGRRAAGSHHAGHVWHG